MQSTELLYRRSAAEGASGFGLLIALYDTLAGNLRRAADAQRKNDLQSRCTEVNHALTVIGYLEDCIERSSGGELATRLVTLYASMRHKLIEAQARQSPEILEEQMDLILGIRESWHDKELSMPTSPSPFTETPSLIDYDHTPAGNTTSWLA
jgi:flagellar protein FliS